MSRLRVVCRTLAVLFISVAIQSRAAGAPIYAVTGLGHVAGTGLNNVGQVVGAGLDSSDGAPPGGGGFLYDGYGPAKGTMVAFGYPFQPNSINDSGLMVGSASKGDGAFGYGTAGGTVTTIANDRPLMGAVRSMNGEGQVLLNEYGPIGQTHAVIQNPDGSHQDVPGVAGQPLVSGAAVNDSGQIAGTTGMYETARAFLFSQGVSRSLGTLPGATSSEANALNNAGQVVGSSAGNGVTHAFLYSNGAMRDLGTLGGTFSVALGINANGEIYGRSTLADGTSHAFLYQAGKMLDLTSLLHSLPSPIAQFSYYDVNGINDRGQLLIGAFNTNADYHSFLLTPDGQPVPSAPEGSPVVVPVAVTPYSPPPEPVPEPTVLAFFAVAGVAVAGRRLIRRRAG